MTINDLSVDHTQVLDAAAEYRKLPAVDNLLRLPEAEALIDRHGQAEMTETTRLLLDEARSAIADGAPAPDPAQLIETIQRRLDERRQPSLIPVINAAGVILHTNLGRAPLSRAARTAVDQVGAGYSNLEYSLDEGQRGSRHEHARKLLCDLTGAEDALVVNNNAAAVYLALAALCTGQEVLVSRGQLVEIGGGFRIPDVINESGCRLVEVGTTNRTHLRDFEAALSSQTGAVMRIHSSNFKQIGFVTQPPMAEIAALLAIFRVEWGTEPLLIDDLGSGTLLDVSRYGLAPEPTVPESLAAGADLVTFSGDKLLGGPQAGLIVGRGELIDRLRRHPMARALRVDKVTLAALEATLHSYRRGRAEDEIPIWMMLSATLEALDERVNSWQKRLSAAGLPAEIEVGKSAIGGGSLPGETLPTVLLALPRANADNVAKRLRQCSPPVVCRIHQDRLLFDPRTVLPEQDDELLSAIEESL